MHNVQETSEQTSGAPSRLRAACVSVDLLTEDLVRSARAVQSQLHQDRDLAVKDFEARRLHVHGKYSQLLLDAEKELQEVLRERAALHARGLHHSRTCGNDVVTLNVGGRLFTVKRETLLHVCPGAFLAELFSGQEQEIQRDSQGLPFLDVDPIIFELLLAWLRDLKIATPERPVHPPKVEREDLQHFQATAGYLGLLPFLSSPRDATLAQRGSREEGEEEERPEEGAAAAVGGEGGEWAAHATPPVPPALPAGDALMQTAGSLLASLRGAAAAAGAVAAASTASVSAAMLGAAPSSDRGPGGNAGSEQEATEEEEEEEEEEQHPAAASVRPPEAKPVGWSRRFAHPAAIFFSSWPPEGDGEGGEAAAARSVVAISDTRGAASAAAVRATRGYQSGLHYWQVEVLTVSDWSYVGFVSAEWVAVNAPVGRAAESWGLASNGIVFACGDEETRLATGYVEGDTVGFLLELGSSGHRTASLYINGTRRLAQAFPDLPGTIYPAVSNMCAPAIYRLDCGCRPPAEVDAAGSQSAGL